MKPKLFNFIFVSTLIISLAIWAYLVVSTHQKDSVVSWDEGFHGGTALFISESLKHNLNFSEFTYILNDFKNGMIWYLPLWSSTAGILGAIFGPSVEIFRMATLFFAILSIVLVAYFAKNIAGNKAGILAALILATVPIFIVYSHLMMIEMPLLFSTSLALVVFYRYLTKEKITKKDTLLTAVSFVIGVSTKVTAVALILGTVIVLGILLKLFSSKSRITSRFYSKTTLYSVLAALLTFLMFRAFTREILNADLIAFYLSQNKQLSGQQGNFIWLALQNLAHNFTFYFRDLTHMPALSVFWIGSSLGYFILKRSFLSVFLWTWIVISFLIFTMVKPQAVQYILPVFTPIALASGLFWAELLRLRSNIVRKWLFLALAFFIPWLGLINLENTETIGWRNTITYQQSAASFVAQNANYGDRVITTGDGSRFLVRLTGLSKKLQTVNGAAPNCTQFIQDSIEWGILDNGPQSPIVLNELQNGNWLKAAVFRGSEQNTFVVKNSNKTDKVEILHQKDNRNRCLRLFSLGDNEVEVWGVSNISESTNLGKDMEISLKLNPLKTLKKVTVKNDELIKNRNIPFGYKFVFNQTLPNKPVYFWLDIPEGIRFDIQKIVVKKSKDSMQN